MTATLAGTPVTATQVRAAMLGTPVDGLRIVRQAWRVSDHDSDELAVVCVRQSSWWVARRTSGRLEVWACPGDDEALVAFERMISEAGHPWREAVAVPLAG